MERREEGRRREVKRRCEGMEEGRAAESQDNRAKLTVLSRPLPKMYRQQTCSDLQRQAEMVAGTISKSLKTK